MLMLVLVLVLVLVLTVTMTMFHLENILRVMVVKWHVNTIAVVNYLPLLCWKYFRR